MKIVNRIDWKRGMSISANAFIESDNYHFFINQIARQLASPNTFGLIPGFTFELESHIVSNQMMIDKVGCTFIDRMGNICQLSQGGKLNLQSLKPGIYFVAVSAENEEHIELEGLPYLQTTFKYHIINILESSQNPLFPLIKLELAEGQWNIRPYIPPCFAVSSHPVLLDLAHLCQQRLSEILTLAENQERNTNATALPFLQIELNDAIPNETAVAFVIQLKKLVFALLSGHLLNQDEELVNKIKAFVAKPYNPNLIYETVQMALSFMAVSIRFLSEAKPTPIVVKPTPELEKELYYLL